MHAAPPGIRLALGHMPPIRMHTNAAQGHG